MAASKIDFTIYTNNTTENTSKPSHTHSNQPTNGQTSRPEKQPPTLSIQQTYPQPNATKPMQPYLTNKPLASRQANEQRNKRTSEQPTSKETQTKK